MVYTTEEVWEYWQSNVSPYHELYFLEDADARIPIEIALCDFTLAELGRTARELEAANLAGILDIRVEPEQNRVAVYADSWDAGKQAELEKALAHPEHCAVTLDAPPDENTVQFPAHWTQGSTLVTGEAAARDVFFRVVERIGNAWWWLPAGSWQRTLCDQNLDGYHVAGMGRYSSFNLYPEDGEAWRPVVHLMCLDGDYTPAWDEWGEAHEAFFRHLLAGLVVTVAHYDEGYNATLLL